MTFRKVLIATPPRDHRRIPHLGPRLFCRRFGDRPPRRRGAQVHEAAAPSVEDAAPGSGAAGLTSPMPGTVVRVLVAEGESVEEGQLLLVLEAMKMEQPFAAPHAGRVRSLPFAEGSLVPGGAVLVELEEPPAGESR